MSLIRPAATVVLLRGDAGAQEVLLLRRNRSLKFAAGAWVFPGGAVDQSDRDGHDEERAARFAAVRECGEEAALAIEPDALQLFAHWLTPEASPKRFSTWFFLHRLVSEEAVAVDGGEITEYRWATPRELIARHRDGDLPLMPPTYVTLLNLAGGRLTPETPVTRPRVLQRFRPRMVMQQERVCFLYQEDAGYQTQDPELPGARHRCYMDGDGCHYESSGWTAPVVSP